MQHRPSRVLALSLLLAAALPALAQMPEETPVEEVPATAPTEAEEPGDGPALGFALEARRLQGMRAQAATLLIQGGQGGQIATAVLAAPVAGAVPVLVEIEGLSLLEPQPQGTELIEVYAYALSPAGSVVDFFTQRIKIDLATWGEAVFTSGVKLVGSLDLPPGEYSLRVLVLDVDTQRYGLRTQPLVVPEPGDGRSNLLAALVPDPAESWVLARAEPDAPGEDGTRGTTPEAAVEPLVAERGGVLPAAWPVLVAGTDSRLDLLAHAIGAEGEVTARIVAEAAPRQDQATLPPPASAPLTFAGRSSVGPGVERLEATMTVPQLPTGAYRLSLRSGSGAGYELPVLVLGDSPAGTEMVWGQIRSTYASPQETARLDTEALPTRRKERNRALEKAARESFRTALATLARGSSPEALTQLAAFETDLLEQAPAEALASLTQAKGEVAARLARKNPESLVPVVTLHIDLYRHYRDQGAFGLATHARQTAADLASLYAESAGTEGAATVASRALAVLGGDLLKARVWTLGEVLLEQALTLDPSNEAALLFLAAHQEKLGRYADAVTTLRRLIGLNPKSAEGRLRLALNLERAGDTAAGQAILRRLVSESNPDWTLTVAYTELAERRLEAGQAGEAALLLRQALDRLPGEQSLVIQLGYALDRQRLFLEARRVMDRLEGAAGSDSSPRHRYAAWPQQGLEDAEVILSQGAGTRLPLLGLTLDDQDGSGAPADDRRRNHRETAAR